LPHMNLERSGMSELSRFGPIPIFILPARNPVPGSHDGTVLRWGVTTLSKIKLQSPDFGWVARPTEH
jgi:hypothetical protein